MQQNNYRPVGNSGDIALDRSTYIRAIALTTLVMIMIFGAGANIAWSWSMNWGVLLASFVGAIICIFVYQGSDNPVISAMGVAGMSFLLGLQVGPLLGAYEAAYKGVVMEALLTTGGIMAAMSVAGVMLPVVFEGFGPFLMAGLFTLIGVQFGQLILIACGVTAAANVPLITWAGVLLFTLFVAWDWVKALRQSYTLDHAIDASGGLVLDFVNLLTRLVKIYADAKK